MNKDSFVFYKSFYEAIRNIPKESQLELYNAICEYSLFGTAPDLSDGIAKAMFIIMQPIIDSANARYKARVENGKRGGRPRKKQDEDNLEETEQKPNDNLEETEQKPKQNLNDNVNDNDNDNVNDNNISKKATTKFKKPTIEEVQNYCKERNNNINAESFIDYYEANGWKVGRNSMKDWKAAVRTWEKRGTKANKPIKNEWFDKKIEKEELSQEEEEEMKSILNKY